MVRFAHFNFMYASFAFGYAEFGRYVDNPPKVLITCMVSIPVEKYSDECALYITHWMSDI